MTGAPGIGWCEAVYAFALWSALARRASRGGGWRQESLSSLVTLSVVGVRGRGMYDRPFAPLGAWVVVSRRHMYSCCV